MPSRYEREGQFGPSDWMNIANSVNSITNSIVKSENQGLVREDQTKKKKLLDATNKAATAMQLGISPEDARTQVNEQTEYDDPGWWGKLTGEEGKTVKSFDPITAETGYQNALTLRGASGKATTDKYVNDYKNQFASLSIKDISNTDFSKQKNPLAARMAAGQMLSLYGKTKEAETRSYAAQEKIGEQMYTQFAGGISEAETLLGKGDAKVSRDIILKLINEGNNTPYKATADGDGIRMFITYDGEDAKDEKILSIPQALSELKNISKVKYIDTYHKNATFHRKLNEETAANPKRLVNKYGDVIQAISRSEPLTNKVEWDVFDKKGNQLPITDLADARKKGYFNAPTGKTAGKSNTGKSGTGTAPKNVTKNMKVLKQAMEMVKTQGSYRVDPSTGTVTDSEGNDVGSQYIEEVLRIMPELGGALETGDVTKLKQMFHIPESGGIADGLLNNSAGLNRSPNVVPTARQLPPGSENTYMDTEIPMGSTF